MKFIKGTSVALVMIFLFNMIGFQTSFAENASDANMAPQEQTETQIVDDVEELEQVENTAQPQPTLDAAQDNEVEEDQEVPSPSAEAVEDTQPDVEAQNPIFQEGATDVWEIEESPVFQDIGESDVITLSDNEYLITGISSRSLEVYVTNGYNPIPNAQVTICGQTVVCDESGYAVFSNIPTADAPYDLIVNCEYGQKTESILLPNTEVVESADAEVPARKATISY